MPRTFSAFRFLPYSPFVGRRRSTGERSKLTTPQPEPHIKLSAKARCKEQDELHDKLPAVVARDARNASGENVLAERQGH